MKKGIVLTVLLVLCGIAVVTAAYAYSGKCNICKCPEYVGTRYNSCANCGHSIAAH